MDGEEEINTDDEFKGWSFRPHQKPTRVSILFLKFDLLALLFS